MQIDPHRDFAVIEKLFGDVDADSCDGMFEFGDEGKPAYILGPGDRLPRQLRAAIARLDAAE
jgi:hypothetical protein